MMKTVCVAAVTAAALAVALLGLAGCGGGGCARCENSFGAQLAGSSVVPAVDTAATATASMSVDPEGPTMDLGIDWQGLSGVTAVRVHVGAAGENGPYVLRIYDAGTDETFTDPYYKHVTAADMEPRPELGLGTCKELCAAVSAGQTYLLISTAGHPQGEIRGQIVRK